MTALATSLFLLSLCLAVWSYLLYPIWIRALAARRPERLPRPAPTAPGSIEVLVAAADEEAVIGDRIRNLLAQEAAGGIAIAVGCDGCTDETAERARGAAPGDPRVRVVEFGQRRGKASVLNDLVASSTSDVLVFTDANTRFDSGAVSALALALGDPGVGAACGRLVLETPESDRTAETQYWERETALKAAEGRLGVCLGANGAIYAARRTSVEPLPAETALDDFLVPARIVRRGEAVVFAGDAVARETLPSALGREISRRFRIGIGAGQILRRELWLWDPSRPLLAFVFFSRKAARWIAPVAFLLALVFSLGSPALRLFGAAGIALCATALVAGASAVRAGGALWRLYDFGVINLALAGGVVVGLLGGRRPAWKPQRSSG